MEESFNSLDPDRQLGYTLARAADAVERAWREALSGNGINPRQFSVLAMLVRDETLSQGELARRVMITPQSMSELLRVLIRDGLVERHDVRPGQAGRLVVTGKGRELLTRAYPVVVDTDEVAFAGLDDRERAELDRLLRKLLF